MEYVWVNEFLVLIGRVLEIKFWMHRRIKLKSLLFMAFDTTWSPHKQPDPEPDFHFVESERPYIIPYNAEHFPGALKPACQQRRSAVLM
jgi:hypothetical protein